MWHCSFFDFDSGGHTFQQSNQFAFLSFYRSNKIGGRNCAEQFMVAAIFMNMRCTFYGNQFTHELNNAMWMSLAELLDLVK